MAIVAASTHWALVGFGIAGLKDDFAKSSLERKADLAMHAKERKADLEALEESRKADYAKHEESRKADQNVIIEKFAQLAKSRKEAAVSLLPLPDRFATRAPAGRLRRSGRGRRDLKIRSTSRTSTTK